MKKRKRYGSMMLFAGLFAGSILQPFTWGEILEVEAAVPTYSQNVFFSERSYNSGSQQITIPSNARNIQATTDNGTVSTSKSGSTLTVNVNGGSYHRTGSYYDSTYYSSYSSSYQTSSSNSFPSSMYYSNGSYSGTLYQSGSSYVSSGTYTPSDSRTETASRQTGVGGSASSLPSSVSYNSGGYSGTLYKSGSSYATGSWREDDTIDARLHKGGTCSDGYMWDGKGWDDGDGGGSWTGASTVSYSNDGYKGTLSFARTLEGACASSAPSGKGSFIGQVKYTSGTATGVYLGTATRPGYDNRVWHQDYSGTVTKPAVDTRIYRQDYAGYTYAPGYGTNYWYQYNVNVTYEADLVAPSLGLTYDKNAGVVRATASDNEYGLSYIQMPNGSTVYSENATYSVTSGGTYTFTAVDAGGNTTSKSITLQAPPIATSQEIPNSTWTSGSEYWFKINTSSVYDTTPLVTLEKNGVKVKEEVTNEMDYTLTENGTYRIKVKDGSIISTKDVTVTNFDRTAPNLAITFDGSTPSDGLEIVATGTDAQSGVKSITLPSGTVVNGSSGVYKTPVEGTFDFVIEDKVGNKQTVTTKVDKPTLSVTKAINAPTNVSSYNLIASFTPKYVTTGQIKNLNTNATTTTNTLNTSVSSNGTYKFQANDGGILSDIEDETVGNFDRLAPNGVISLDPSTPNDGLDIKIDATDDASGVKSITLPNNQVVNGDKAFYKTTTSGTFSFVIEDVAGNKKTVSTTINKPVLTVTKEFSTPTNGASMKLNASFTPQYVSKGSISRDGVDVQGNQLESIVTENGTYRFRANDGGVLSDYVDVVVGNFDRNAPTGAISYDGSTPSDGLDVNVVSTDDNSGVKSITLPNNNVVSSSTANFKTSTPGSYDFILEDKAGNKRTVTAVVEKPKLNVNQATTGQTNASSYNLNASFTPKYVATGQIKNFTNGGTYTTNSLNYTVSNNGSYRFQANDGGILSDIEMMEVKNFDRTVPTGSIRYDGSSPEDGLNILIDGTDTESPIKSITQPNGIVKNEASIDYTVTSPGNYSFIIEDAAGNKRTVTATITKPTASAVKTVTTPTNASEYQLTVSPSAPRYVNIMKIEELYRNDTFYSNGLPYMAKQNGDYRFRLNDGGILSDYIDVSITNFDRAKPVINMTEKAKTASYSTINVKVLDKGDLK